MWGHCGTRSTSDRKLTPPTKLGLAVEILQTHSIRRVPKAWLEPARIVTSLYFDGVLTAKDDETALISVCLPSSSKTSSPRWDSVQTAMSSVEDDIIQFEGAVSPSEILDIARCADPLYPRGLKVVREWVCDVALSAVPLSLDRKSWAIEATVHEDDSWMAFEGDYLTHRCGSTIHGFTERVYHVSVAPFVRISLDSPQGSSECRGYSLGPIIQRALALRQILSEKAGTSHARESFGALGKVQQKLPCIFVCERFLPGVTLKSFSDGKALAAFSDHTLARTTSDGVNFILGDGSEYLLPLKSVSEAAVPQALRSRARLLLNFASWAALPPEARAELEKRALCAKAMAESSLRRSALFISRQRHDKKI